MPLAAALGDLARGVRRLVQQALRAEVRTRQDSEEGALVARSEVDPLTGELTLLEEGPASPEDPAARAHHDSLAATHARQLHDLGQMLPDGEGSAEAG